DLDRSVLSRGVPFSAFSSGIVTRLSTSSVERPGASVWISTRGGANSGKTSSGVERTARIPARIKTSAAARTSTRRRSEVETSQVMIAVLFGSLARPELGAEELGRAVGDHPGARL